MLAALALVALAWWPGLTGLAEQHIDAGLKRALVSFGAARALNAILAVLQGTAVSAQPLGIGVTLSLGQVLEPVNRIVEQFSSLMLFASVAFGVQRVLLAIGSWWPVSAALSVATLFWCWTVWSTRSLRSRLSQLVVILLVFRFAVPVAVLGSEFLFQQFLSDRYATSLLALEKVSGQVRQSAPANPQQPDARNWTDRLKDLALAPVNEVKQRYEILRAAAENAVDRMIQLMVVFVLQTVLMPLLFLWALIRAGRMLVDSTLTDLRLGIRPAGATPPTTPAPPPARLP